MSLMIGFTGLRGVGKSTAADMLVEMGFAKAHAFGPGKAMCVPYYEYLGIDHDTAQRMVYGDLKDTPHPKLPGGVDSRYFMERFGRFMGVEMGPDWTLGVELDKMQRDGVERVVIESLVYEAPVFLDRGGVVVRILRAGTTITGDRSDEYQATIRADFVIRNDGSRDQLLAKLTKLIELVNYYRANPTVAWLAEGEI